MLIHSDASHNAHSFTATNDINGKHFQSNDTNP
jgi:hypothetical protein